MKKPYVIGGLAALILIVAAISNPSSEVHKETIKTKLNAYIQKSMSKENSSDDELGAAGNAFGMMLGGFIVDKIVDHMVSTNNYILFSTTQINWEGESKTIGIGAFGNVFITGQLDEALNKGLMSPKE